RRRVNRRLAAFETSGAPLVCPYNKRRMKRLVVKVGTNTLTGGGEGLSHVPMMGLVRQVARLVRDGHQVAVVSSGAIVAGREALQILPEKAAAARSKDTSSGEPRHGAAFAARRRDIPFKQVLAAVGQAKLMQTWDQLFA